MLYKKNKEIYIYIVKLSIFLGLICTFKMSISSQLEWNSNLKYRSLKGKKTENKNIKEKEKKPNWAARGVFGPLPCSPRALPAQTEACITYVWTPLVRPVFLGA
jgi:hypothetical protein